MEMNITRALAELKLLDSRINKEMKIDFVTIKKNSADKVKRGTTTIDDFNKDVKAKYDSITDLIERRDNIKSAIVKSNATTHVVIGGVSMTVADAIERKTSITYRQSLLRQLKTSYASAEQALQTENMRLERVAEDMINNMIGGEAKGNKDVVANANEVAKQYVENNKIILVDPISIVTKMDTLEREIDTFLAEVDYILSTSNSLTTIAVK